MVTNKRNKIHLSSSSADNENGSKLNGLSKVKISLLPDDEDMDEEDAMPITLVKKQPTNKPRVTETSIGGTANYTGLFKSKAEVQILNLDDMVDDEIDDNEASTDIPTKAEIEHMIHQKFKRKRNANLEDTIREKDYVSLLDEDDKIDIIDTIKKQGGMVEDDLWMEREMPNELEEEELLLGESAKLAHRKQKKQIIEDALSEQQTDSRKEWESQLLSRVSGNTKSKVLDQPLLPKLYSFDQEDDSDKNKIESKLAASQRRKRQLLLQLKILVQEKGSLEDRKKTIITHLT